MTTETKCQVIVTATFNEGGNQTPEFQEYSPKAAEIIAAHGGSVTGKYMVGGNLGNGSAPHAILTINFPSQKNAEDTFASEAYQKILPQRAVAFKDINILITKPA